MYDFINFVARRLDFEPSNVDISIIKRFNYSINDAVCGSEYCKSDRKILVINNKKVNLCHVLN